MKVIVDLHAIEGSQNGFEHSGTRDGYTEWGYSYIPQTVSVIEFLAKRFCLYISKDIVKDTNNFINGKKLWVMQTFVRHMLNNLKRAILYLKT